MRSNIPIHNHIPVSTASTTTSSDIRHPTDTLTQHACTRSHATNTPHKTRTHSHTTHTHSHTATQTQQHQRSCMLTYTHKTTKGQTINERQRNLHTGAGVPVRENWTYGSRAYLGGLCPVFPATPAPITKVINVGRVLRGRHRFHSGVLIFRC